MGVAALAPDKYSVQTPVLSGKENYSEVNEGSKSFESHLSDISEKKCSYDDLPETDTNDAGKESETKESSLLEQINSYKNEIYDKLLNNETEVKIRIGSQEFSEKEWDKLIERVDKEQERVQEALKEKEEKRIKEEFEDKIQELFDERKE
jgi:hypothetical protein